MVATEWQQRRPGVLATLGDLHRGEGAILEEIDLPEDAARG